MGDPFYLAGNYNAIVSSVVTFQREVFLKTFISLFSEAIVLQNSRSFNSRKLFCAIVMSTNNSEANITCTLVENRVYRVKSNGKVKGV